MIETVLNIYLEHPDYTLYLKDLKNVHGIKCKGTFELLYIRSSFWKKKYWNDIVQMNYLLIDWFRFKIQLNLLVFRLQLKAKVMFYNKELKLITLELENYYSKQVHVNYWQFFYSPAVVSPHLALVFVQFIVRAADEIFVFGTLFVAGRRSSAVMQRHLND